MATLPSVRDAPIAPEAVEAFAEALARRMEPVCIVLFGSYAAGAPDARSDLDLLVVLDTDRPPHKRTLPFHDTIREAPRPTDVIVRTPAEVRRWLGTPNHIVTEAFQKGTILYQFPGAERFEPMSSRHVEWAEEFIEKAESDLLTARRVMEMEDGPTDTPAFHAQQAAEKALKAILTVYDIDAPYTHELPELVDALPEEVPSLEGWRADLKAISPYGVAVRYPLGMPDLSREEVQRAIEVAEEMLRRARAEVGEREESEDDGENNDEPDD